MITAISAPLILASASPRRKELLATLIRPFGVITAEVVEHEHPDTDPREMVFHNAALKADWVAARHTDSWVLGADTTVFIDGVVLNKPANLQEAETMLRRLSGRTHSVFTGLALRHETQGVKIDRGAESEVAFKPLNETIIADYLSKVHTLDKAGGYAIQEFGELIIAHQSGSFTNIVGLPLELTKQILTEVGLLA